MGSHGNTRDLGQPTASGGASENEKSWHARPRIAWAIRAAQFCVPFLAGWLAIRALQPSFFEGPDHRWYALFVWAVQAIFVSGVVAAVTARLLDRFTPLAMLYNMTLVFPDHVPSRFGVALRAGGVKRLLEQPNVTLSESTQEAAEQAVQLVTLLAKHEPMTRGHAERVRAYADVIGQEMGLSEDDLNGLRWGALLHDVGKLSVPTEILNKPGKPTAEEWKVLRGHPWAAVSMLEPLREWLGDWLLAAPEHHERFDGNGYPLGLSGRDISLAGRIVCVADAYDVITSKRSYKVPFSHEVARNEMVDSAGTQFDPVVVRALLEAGVKAPASARRFGWLLELPGVSSALAQGSQVVVSTVAAVAVATGISVSAASIDVPDVDPPDSVAFSAESIGATESSEEPQSAVDDASAGRGDTESSGVSRDALPADRSTTTTSLDVTESSTTSTDPDAPTSTALAVDNDVTQTSLAPTSTNPSVTTTTLSGPATSTTTTTTQATTTTTAAPATTASTTTTTVATTTTTSAPAGDCALIRQGTTFLPEADLDGCDLSGLTLDGLQIHDASLINANLSGATLTNFNLNGANLQGANLAGLSLTAGSAIDANFRNVDATKFSARTVDFWLSDFTGADLREARLDTSSFRETIMNNADLSSANFIGANFNGAEMISTSLVEVNAQGTEFADAEINSMNLRGADLSRAVFWNATGVPSQADAATYALTTCPNGQAQNSSCW